MIKQRFLLIAICCFFVASGAMAQRGQVKGLKSTMTEETKISLNLSDEQRAQIDALQAETATSLQAVRQQDGDKAAAMREVKAADQARLEEILTSEQLLRLRNINTEAKGDRTIEKVEEERTRVRPEQEERTRVRTTEKGSEVEQSTEERVRTTEQPQRTRERVRTEGTERTRERVRTENGDRRSEMSAEDREKMQTEITAYRESNIEPAMQVQRQKLDAAMSAEDRARLTALRSELSANRELRSARQNKEVSAMVSKYDDQISSLLAELEPRKAQWKADQNIIRAKYMTPTNDGTRRSESEIEGRSRGVETSDLDEKVRFLLLNSNRERR